MIALSNRLLPIRKIVAFASEVFLYGETTRISYRKVNQTFLIYKILTAKYAKMF